MKKSNILCGFIIGVGLFLTGCGNSFDAMPNLTEEESRLIAEYAASILIKHDKNAGKLASDSEIAAADEREATLRANTEALQALLEDETEETSEEGQENSTSEGSAPSEPVAAAFEGIAQFCGLDGFRIEYVGHSICDSYPPADSEELVFAMDATAGNRLLVLQFVAENTTAEDLELNTLDRNIRFRISVNDGEMSNALSTLLLDDLASYKEVVPAGTSVTLVLTREVTEAEAGGVSTISLSLKNESDSAITLLE